MASREKKKLSEIPVSLEAIRRKIMLVAHNVEKEISLFLDKYVSGIGDTTNWLALSDEIARRGGKPIENVEDHKAFTPLLKKAKGNWEIVDQPEYRGLKKMVQRAQMFDYIAFSLKDELQKCCETQLQKYCLSFAAEGENAELASVNDYENKIIMWTRQISDRLVLLDSQLDEVDKMRSPFTDYLQNYAKLVKLMENACNTMVRICEPVKRWVMTDSLYAKRIQEEIMECSRRKIELSSTIQRMQYDRDQMGVKVKRRVWQTLKLDRELAEERNNKRHFKRRENTVRENYVKAEAELQRKRADLEEVKSRIKNRRENSPSLFNYLTGMAETLRDDILKLEGKLEVLQGQLTNLRQEQHDVQRELDRIGQEINFHMLQHENALMKLERQETSIQDRREDIKDIENKLRFLKRIRELKLHTDTVKKIYHSGYRPGQMSENKDDLETAIKITAADVGKNWAELYQKLPFIPPRDFRERTHDIEVIDLSSRRLYGSFYTLSMKSLEKWRRLSRAATVDGLVNTLKRLHKLDIAQRIERQVVSVK